MRRGGDQIRQSDVTLWGGAALLCWALAVLAANLSALMPTSVLMGLHASRVDGGTLNQLRGQVAGLEADAARLRRETAALERRFEMAMEQSGTVTQRVGALEASLPRVLESLQAAQRIDRSAVTASTGAEGPQHLPAEGGSVVVRQRPLQPDSAAREALAPLPMPAPLDLTALAATPESLGIALGGTVAPADAEAEWQRLEARVGTLLIGLGPLLEQPGSDGRVRLLAGPVAGAAEAEALCTHLKMVAVACSPATFAGTPLPGAN